MNMQIKNDFLVSWIFPNETHFPNARNKKKH